MAKRRDINGNVDDENPDGDQGAPEAPHIRTIKLPDDQELDLAVLNKAEIMQVISHLRERLEALEGVTVQQADKPFVQDDLDETVQYFKIRFKEDPLEELEPEMGEGLSEFLDLPEHQPEPEVIIQEPPETLGEGLDEILEEDERPEPDISPSSPPSDDESSLPEGPPEPPTPPESPEEPSEPTRPPEDRREGMSRRELLGLSAAAGAVGIAAVFRNSVAGLLMPTDAKKSGLSGTSGSVLAHYEDDFSEPTYRDDYAEPVYDDEFPQPYANDDAIEKQYYERVIREKAEAEAARKKAEGGGWFDWFKSKKGYIPLDRDHPPLSLMARAQMEAEAEKSGNELEWDETTRNYLYKSLLGSSIDGILVQEEVVGGKVVLKEEVMERFLVAAQILIKEGINVTVTSHYRRNQKQHEIITGGQAVDGMAGPIASSFHLLGQALDIDQAQRNDKTGRRVRQVMQQAGFIWGIPENSYYGKGKNIAKGVLSGILGGDLDQIYDAAAKSGKKDKVHFSMSKSRLNATKGAFKKLKKKHGLGEDGEPQQDKKPKKKGKKRLRDRVKDRFKKKK